MHIKILMDQLVPLKLHYDLLRVVIVRIRRQVHIFRVVEAGAFPGLMIGHQGNDLVTAGCRPLAVSKRHRHRFKHAIPQHVEAGVGAISHHILLLAAVAILENDVIRCPVPCAVDRLIPEGFLDVATVRFSYIAESCLASLVILIREALNRGFTNFYCLELSDPCIEKIVSDALLGPFTIKIAFLARNGL